MTTLPLFKILTTSEWKAQKDTSAYPQAQFIFVRSEKTDHRGMFPIHYIEIITDLKAPWITKSTAGMMEGDPMLQVLTEEMKHICWGCKDALYSDRFAILEHGLHVYTSAKQDGIIGMVAGWNSNPKFAPYMPMEDVWYTLRFLNGHYRAGELAPEGQALKHDYMDLALTSAVNFRILLPNWLGNEWVDTVIEALSVPLEESGEVAAKHLRKFFENKRAYQTARQQTDNGVEAKGVEAKTSLGETLEFDKLAQGTELFVYFPFIRDGKIKDMTFLRHITWDGSAFVKNLVNGFRKHIFSTKEMSDQDIAAYIEKANAA